jgi:3-oxoacyl-[acyl-carrier-protein] synthase II
MVGVNDIVITGLGCVTPIGIGRAALWQSLAAGQCGISPLHITRDPQRLVFYGARIDDFDGKQHVTPRKALKVMSREVQLAYASAQLAWEDAALGQCELIPERVGVVYGSEMIPGDLEDFTGAVRACSRNGVMDSTAWGTSFSKHIFPLWMLRNLPNMPACHVGIAIDARGPNNTIAQEEVSSLLAISEAAAVIDRGQADLMVVGAIGSRINPTRLMYRAPGLYDQHPLDDQPQRCIPFDARRRGIVPGEGAGTIVLERRSHAVRRGAKIYGVLQSCACGFGRPATVRSGSAAALTQVMHTALERASIGPEDLSHLSAQGYSEKHLDVSEATAIAQVAPGIPVSAFSSHFGTVGAASGMLELIASLLAAREGVVLPILGYKKIDKACPITTNSSAQPAAEPWFLKLSFTPTGHAAAVVVQCIK